MNDKRTKNDRKQYMMKRGLLKKYTYISFIVTVNTDEHNVKGK